MNNYEADSGDPEFDLQELKLKLVNALQPYVRDCDLLDTVNMTVVLNALAHVLAIFSTVFEADKEGVVKMFLTCYSDIERSRNDDSEA